MSLRNIIANGRAAYAALLSWQNREGLLLDIIDNTSNANNDKGKV